MITCKSEVRYTHMKFYKSKFHYSNIHINSQTIRHKVIKTPQSMSDDMYSIGKINNEIIDITKIVYCVCRTDKACNHRHMFQCNRFNKCNS